MVVLPQPGPPGTHAGKVDPYAMIGPTVHVRIPAQHTKHMFNRRLRLAVYGLLLLAVPSLGQTPDQALTLVTAEGRSQLQTVTLDGRRMVALERLTGPFGLTIGGELGNSSLTLSRGDQVIVLTANEGLVSVDGQLVSLPSSPIEQNGTWYVPVDFIGRALPLVSDEPLELRRRSGLVVMGDIRVPQVVARYRRTGRQGRLGFMVTPAIEPTVERQDDRLVITFDADALDLAPTNVSPDPLVVGLAADQNRPVVTVELGAEFGSYASVVEPALGNAIELVIDLEPTAPAPPPPAPTRTTELRPTPPPPVTPPAPQPPLAGVPAPPAGAPAPAATAGDPDLPALSELAAPRTIRAIAIDPGHGGADTGTRGPGGALEKDVTLEVARRLRNAIESQLGLRVVLTRTSDTTVALDERAAIANNNRADLFISLHVNASVRETATGAEVFYLSLAEYDEAARDLSALAAEPIPVVGGGSRVLDIVPWEMAQLRYVGESARWATTVADELSLRLPMSPRGLQQAPFRVLVGANMPAVLVELGFISNPDQEAQLTSPTFQTAIVNGLLRSIIRYRDEAARGFVTPTPLTPGAPGAAAPTGRIQ